MVVGTAFSYEDPYDALKSWNYRKGEDDGGIQSDDSCGGTL